MSGDFGTKTNKQVALIQEVFSLNLPVFLMGGFAEEALIYGKAVGEHGDIDLGILRKNKRRVEEGFLTLGCAIEERFEQGLIEPYKLEVTKDDLKIDVVFIDWDLEKDLPYVEVKNTFGKGRVRAYFDRNIFNWTGQKLGEVEVRTASPLSLMQMREGYLMVRRGEPRLKDSQVQEALRQKFFPDRSVKSPMFIPEIVWLN